MLAYLVIREGSKWSDVFRLIPGENVTIGRAPTNRIALKDERCSRFHAEVFSSGDHWGVRDLESRNGTLVGERPVQDDVLLSPGDVIRIGNSQLAFVHDLTKAFPESGGLVRPRATGEALGDTGVTGAIEDSSSYEPTTITHRRAHTRYLQPAREAGESHNNPAAARLCRLAFELAKAVDPSALAEKALEGLFECTHVDAGALLLVPGAFSGSAASAADLKAGTPALDVVASRSQTPVPYHRVSPFLAAAVLTKGEAVLARNVIGDSTVSSRDSKGEIHATSVLCAPVRRGRKVYGLVHLYSTRFDRSPDPDDLEFTLAVADTVAVALENLSRREQLAENLTQARDENLQLRERLGAQSEIVGNGPAVRRIMDEIARAAPTHATVLVCGESGVGKELVARAVHFSSPRRKGPFVCLNCAALSESLLESELFGHERGAFTGAHSRKIGKFEAAHQGTLMLDEIGEMSPAIQAKFLRVLEGHPFERVGGTEPVKVDVRVIAATNRDLEKAVGDGLFRRDLYFRLHVLEIVVPPLRERPDDIAELARYFLRKFTHETGRRIRGFTPGAMEQLSRYRWPGNVRELKNVIERAVVLARGDLIDQENLMLSKLPAGEADPAAQTVEFQALSLEEMERRHILATLQATGWNKSQTASLLGIERSTLDRKIRRYNLADLAPGRRR
ncbi:MAG TPA: sigma 54-interacting transcriptional regulator [Pirellulales bacterium]|jgi:Nif-specific regulatory protein|nr:sigma 54-interacting transcriptional regulator [Pirellulales bacterium]